MRPIILLKFKHLSIHQSHNMKAASKSIITRNLIVMDFEKSLVQSQWKMVHIKNRNAIIYLLFSFIITYNIFFIQE
ncbi:MAG: hypothetical protein DRR19_14250 [Candidatus Parabeggiatoa sp. nov. 1]|nr:MAG: hypothetical protein DRR19_14250 [Gammaproteobacteria bacterium]